MKIMQL